MKKASAKGSTDLFTLVKQEGLFYNSDHVTLFSGKYHWNYPSGILAEEGYMSNGVVDGSVKLYNEEGTLLVEAEYKDGKKNGLITTYYPSGHIKAEFTLENDQREGRMRIWYEGGVKKYEACFKNNMLNGKQIKYYPNGNVNIECEYKDNLEHGQKSVLKEDGTLLFSGIFMDGELT